MFRTILSRFLLQITQLNDFLYRGMCTLNDDVMHRTTEKHYVVLTVHLITVEIYFTLPTYTQYLTIVSIHPYTYFGLFIAILRGSQC
jgi:hypothetical protein